MYPLLGPTKTQSRLFRGPVIPKTELESLGNFNLFAAKIRLGQNLDEKTIQLMAKSAGFKLSFENGISNFKINLTANNGASLEFVGNSFETALQKLCSK